MKKSILTITAVVAFAFQVQAVTAEEYEMKKIVIRSTVSVLTVVENAEAMRPRDPSSCESVNVAPSVKIEIESEGRPKIWDNRFFRML